MLTEAELTAMRDCAISALPDECWIRRPSEAEGTVDPSTGVYTPAAPTTIYEGPCLMRPPSSEEVEVLHGDTEVSKQRFMLRLPWDVATIRVGDRVTFTRSSDPNIAGRPFRVTGHESGSHHIFRSVALEAIE